MFTAHSVTFSKVLKSVSHLVLVISLAGNFGIYCLANKAFRKVSRRMIMNISNSIQTTWCNTHLRLAYSQLALVKRLRV